MAQYYYAGSDLRMRTHDDFELAARADGLLPRLGQNPKDALKSNLAFLIAAFAVFSLVAIAQAQIVITWANPADIACRTALGDAQLDATANVAGVFACNPPLGVILGAGGNQPSLCVSRPPARATLSQTSCKMTSGLRPTF